jgi:hypothetical protein
MYILSFTPNESGPAVDDGLRFLSGFILKQFPAGNKVLKEEMRIKPFLNMCMEIECLN